MRRPGGTVSFPEHSASELTVRVDPRIELLAVVWMMSGYGQRHEGQGRISCDASPYSEAVTHWFSPYNNHEAINYIQENSSTFSGDLPVALALHLSDPPDLEWRVPCDTILAGRAGGVHMAERFADAMRSFARDTAFDQFFHTQKEYFQTILAKPGRSLSAGHWIEDLEAYTGDQLRGYHLIPAPLFKAIAFGPRVRWNDGTLEAYCVIPAKGVAGERITFQTDPTAQNILVHEFTHSFVNPLVEKHRTQIEQSASLMRRINYKTGASYGAVWEISVAEHIVRAITTRIVAKRYGLAQARKELAIHEKQGFLFTGDLCDRLQEYERRRDTYPMLASFFPTLLDSFREYLFST
ncbi:DUF4932 domain-containing protein [bacterium]|nr:DUF4932 domain-containing protein [bacterium]